MDCDKNELKISVLISTYRRSSLLVRLLDSIRQQHYSNSEIIIVDDASGDETEEVVRNYISDNPDLSIVLVVNEHNSGAGECKRRAYLEAGGDIIIFSDDDDYYTDPTYFNSLNEIYSQHSDCSMTIAVTFDHYETEGKYVFRELNTPFSLSNREYLNGFMEKYAKPSSMFTLSMRSRYLKEIHFEELKYFNDTALYLFALLGEGKIYTINEAVGAYCIHDSNMTGQAKADYTLNNLEAKDDIFLRANSRGLLDDPGEWRYRNLAVTASNYLANNRMVTEEDKVVWKWMKEHFDRTRYYRFVLRIMKTRLKHGLPISMMWVNP